MPDNIVDPRKIHIKGKVLAGNPPEISVYRDTIALDLMYPPYETEEPSGYLRYVQVGMCHVRAADDIRISYDFERNGWKIEQASTFQWDADDLVCDPDWQEVVFVQAWARKTDCDD